MLIRILTLLVLALSQLWPQKVVASTPIMGEQEADAERMYQFVASRNPDFQREIASAFHEIGEIYGIRGDIALCQAVIETGWFKFHNGTAVRAEDHNYCGLGVHTQGERGCRFESVHEGVTAMIQHLFAYACKDELPEGERVSDPRFKFVRRGVAPTWEALSGRWAMNQNYGRHILDIYASMMRFEPSEVEVETIEVRIPEPEKMTPDGGRRDRPEPTPDDGPTVTWDACVTN